MPNIAAVLKNEISRIARKEVKAELLSLKSAATSHRREIAKLKQRAMSLEKMLSQLASTKAKSPAPAAAGRDNGGAKRFSPKGLLAHRKRLGLSAAEVGVLLGTSSQSIYNWEQGKSRPRASHLEAIGALRTLGKKDAAAVIVSRAVAADPAV